MLKVFDPFYYSASSMILELVNWNVPNMYFLGINFKDDCVYSYVKIAQIYKNKGMYNLYIVRKWLHLNYYFTIYLVKNVLLFFSKLLILLIKASLFRIRA